MVQASYLLFLDAAFAASSRALRSIMQPEVGFWKLPLCSFKCSSLPLTNFILSGLSAKLGCASTLLMWWPSYPETVPLLSNSAFSALVHGLVPCPVNLTSLFSCLQARATPLRRAFSSSSHGSDGHPHRFFAGLFRCLANPSSSVHPEVFGAYINSFIPPNNPIGS